MSIFEDEWNGDPPEGYDTAQICLNGHMINSSSVESPQFSKDFCTTCGKSTITQCPNCKTPIRGYYHGGASFEPDVPHFCHGCGQSYPWTAARIEAAQELASELDGLDDHERKLLAGTIDDIVRDSPKTTVAATRFKKIIAKSGKVAIDSFKEILVDVVSETAKKMLWP